MTEKTAEKKNQQQKRKDNLAKNLRENLLRRKMAKATEPTEQK